MKLFLESFSKTLQKAFLSTYNSYIFHNLPFLELFID